MTLLNEQIAIDAGFIKIELENGNLGRALNFRRQKDHREYILRSYFDQRLAAVKKLEELKDRWNAKFVLHSDCADGMTSVVITSTSIYHRCIMYA
ncbi:hypothetical protein PanWU01x14_095000 [Parasponia andersonii]|uniref:Uncharacterized protein n=1 Tax=Parasponia andersonii TaxID=3476 RepID=A0A2P5D5F0_PARAD|nr:hypothetical protein PanWU01x14_095000 [Parasponia andersonii]